MPNHVQHSIDNLPDSDTKSADILNLYCPYVTSEMYVNEKLKSCLFFSRFQEEVSDFQFIRFLIIKILKTQRAQTLQVKKKNSRDINFSRRRHLNWKKKEKHLKTFE